MIATIRNLTVLSLATALLLLAGIGHATSASARDVMMASKRDTTPTPRYATCPNSRHWGPTGYINEMQWIIVTFDTLRVVCVNGREAGKTQKIMAIKPDESLVITLAGPQDYQAPYEQIVSSGGTHAVPMRIIFRTKENGGM